MSWRFSLAVSRRDLTPRCRPGRRFADRLRCRSWRKTRLVPRRRPSIRVSGLSSKTRQAFSGTWPTCWHWSRTGAAPCRRARRSRSAGHPLGSGSGNDCARVGAGTARGLGQRHRAARGLRRAALTGPQRGMREGSVFPTGGAAGKPGGLWAIPPGHRRPLPHPHCTRTRTRCQPAGRLRRAAR